MVECQLPKLDVVGSNPVSRSKIKNLQEPPNQPYCNYCVKLFHHY